jgi:hypothetical protein
MNSSGKPFYKKRWLIITLASLLFIVIQTFRPKLDNPPVTEDIKTPDNVKQILKRACYDCHSNETELRWFDKIQPAYSLVATHIRDGRAGLNFSTWDSLAPGDRKGKLFESLNQVLADAMPLNSYTFIHRSAKLSPDDIAVLKNYVASLVVSKPADTGKINAADKQYARWKNGMVVKKDLPIALNGISYMPDYKNWAAISTTERFDNGTMRVIYGNDVAVKAIKENRINPWPNGTILAKVAWDQLEDKNGNVQTGEFKQIEYMIKDSKKYADTKGWGFARFKTTEFLPYGKNISFATECVNCHRPMENNDFVFTVPVNKVAPLPSDLDLKAMGLTVFNSSINKKTGTMSTTYANKRVKAVVTWKQKDDEHWFGAKIPGKVVSVKLVKAAALTQRESVKP